MKFSVADFCMCTIMIIERNLRIPNDFYYYDTTIHLEPSTAKQFHRKLLGVEEMFTPFPASSATQVDTTQAESM